jgi:hypothetical protein
MIPTRQGSTQFFKGPHFPWNRKSAGFVNPASTDACPVSEEAAPVVALLLLAVPPSGRSVTEEFLIR